MKKIEHLEKLPPQNLEAEQSVLGAMILDGVAIQVAKEILVTDDFYRENHRKIYAAILELAAEGKEADIITLADKLINNGDLEMIGGEQYVSMLAETIPTSANVKYHAKIVKEKSLLRKLLQNSIKIAQMVYEEAEDLPLLLFKSQEALRQISSRCGSEEVGRMSVSEENLTDHIAYFKETPLECLNKYIAGFPAKNLTIIGGRAGMGKTAMQLSFLRKICIEDGFPAVYFGSSNHTKETIFLRLLSAMCEIDFNDLKRGKVSAKEMEKVRKAHQKINESKLHVKFESSMNVFSIISGIKALRGKIGELGLIVIENLQDLNWPEKCRTKKESMDKILEALRGCVNEVKTPTSASSQINRTSEEEKDSLPRLSDLKDSGNIEDLADMVFLLHREDYHEKTSANGAPQNGKIIIAKGGPAVIVDAKFYGHLCNWRDN